MLPIRALRDRIAIFAAAQKAYPATTALQRLTPAATYLFTGSVDLTSALNAAVAATLQWAVQELKVVVTTSMKVDTAPMLQLPS